MSALPGDPGLHAAARALAQILREKHPELSWTVTVLPANRPHADAPATAQTGRRASGQLADSGPVAPARRSL